MELLNDSEAELSSQEESGDDSDDDPTYILNEEDDEGMELTEATSLGNHANKRKGPTVWRKTDAFSPTRVYWEEGPSIPQPNAVEEEQDKNSQRLIQFNAYFEDSFFETIASMTNMNFMKKTGRMLNTSAEEMRKFFGIILIVGCIRMKRLRHYWKKDTRIPCVADAMTRTRFFQLRNYVKLVNDDDVTAEEKRVNLLWKVQPMVEAILKTTSIIPKEKALCIDEQMISFTGRCPARQFVPRKPSPTGLKVFVLASAKGMVYDFILYQGKSTFSSYQLLGKPAGQGIGAVLHLTRHLPSGHDIYCDRFFTTLPLIEHLKTKGLTLTGTVSAKFVPCKFSSDAEMRKRPRGDCEQFVGGGIALNKWFDNKPVLMASSLHGKEPMQKCKRYSKKDKSYLEVNRPAVVQEYNRCMGGVDLCDQMMAYHSLTAKSRRWPVRVISHFLDLAINNLWRQERNTSKIQLFDFRLELGKALVGSPEEPETDDNGSDAECPPDGRLVAPPSRQVRRAGAKHMPRWLDMKNSARCRRRGCTSKTSVMCVRCRVYLCVAKGRNCFEQYHQ